MKNIYLYLFLSLSLVIVCKNQIFAQFAGGIGTEADPYIILNAGHLNNVRDFPDSWFRQEADIDFNLSPNDSFHDWEPIGGNNTDIRFTGHYNGNGHVIKNLNVISVGYANVGLFGHIGEDGTVATSIRNLGLLHVTVVGGRGTGALVGRVTGNQNTQIENCYVDGGDVIGEGATGGLVGSNNSYMTNASAAESFRPVIYRCWTRVNVSLTNEDAPGKDKFGGIAGCNQKGLISNSYARGNVDVPGGIRIGGLAGCVELRGILIDSYSTGQVSAGDATELVGGLVGMVGVGRNMGTVSNSYWDINTSGMTQSAGGIGLTTAQMKTAESYPEWDFAFTWQFSELENDNYPVIMDIYNPGTLWTWIPGSGSTDWNIASNWDQESVPPTGAGVKIPVSDTYPVIDQDLSFQLLIMEGNSEIEIQNPFTIYIKDNLVTNDGTPMISGEGFVEFSGNSFQNIPHIRVNNLRIKNFNNTKLTGDLYVDGVLEMEKGMLDLNGYVIFLDTDAKLIENEFENTASRVFGLDGYLQLQRNLNNPSGEISGIGLEIQSDKNLGSTLLRRGHSELNYTDESRSILRWFDIIPQNNENLDATIVFHYFTGELNMYDESSNFSLFKSAEHNYTPGMDWIWVPAEVDALNKKITAHNIENFSRWTAGSSDDSLPISLLSFTAEVVQSSEIHIEWITLTEVNNDFFTVETSGDGISWKTLTHVYGAGTTNNTVYYSVTDENPLTGISYYRLLQTDFDGTTEVFPPVSVNMQPVTDESITIYPNPGNGNFNINFMGDKDTECRIFDMQGKLVYSSILEAFSVNNFYLASQLHTGLYTVVIYSNEISSHKLFVR